MNKKTATYIIIAIVIAIFIVCFGIFIKGNIDKSNESNNTNIVEESNAMPNNGVIEFLRSIQGLKIESLELIDNPVGFEGSFLVPKEALKNGVDYFLKESKNEKISKVNVDIGDGYIKANVDYKIIAGVTTPIEVKVNPSLNENKDLVLKIEEVKFLDLKIANWIVNIGVKNFIKDWFPENSEMKVQFNDGNVVIDKSNLKGVILNNIKIDSEVLKLDIIIDMESFYKK